MNHVPTTAIRFSNLQGCECRAKRASSDVLEREVKKGGGDGREGLEQEGGEGRRVQQAEPSSFPSAALSSVIFNLNEKQNSTTALVNKDKLQRFENIYFEEHL